MTSIQLQQIESELEIILPEYYKTIMLNYPAILSGQICEDFELINYPEKIIEENKSAYKDFWGRKLNKQYMIIGDNGCGDYFLINLKQESCIYSFYHDNQSFYRVSDTLLEFTNIILEGQYEKYWGNEKFQTQDLRK